MNNTNLMEKDKDVFKHFLIDEGAIEKLIEIWTHFNPNDTPYPLTKSTVFLNNKYNDVTGEQLLHSIKFSVFHNLYWLDRFHVMCFTLKTYKPIDFLYKFFVENHLTKNDEKVVKRKAIEDIDELSKDVIETPKKERKKKSKE